MDHVGDRSADGRRRRGICTSSLAGLFILVTLLATLLIIVVAPRQAAAAGWSAQRSGTRMLLHDVEFVDARTGWAVGAVGTIRATTDGGTTWRAQSSGTANTLFEADFVDALNGWIVGQNGTILHTSDGGATWTRQSSGVTDPIYGVSFIDTLEGWAGGPAGIFNSLMLHTTDGGATWTRELLPYGPDIVVTTTWRDVAFADATHGWFVGDDQVAFPELTAVEPPPFGHASVGAGTQLQAVDFASSTRAWAVGSRGKIVATTDGVTWVPQQSGITAGLVDVSAVDASRVWALAGQGALLSTVNGGASWQRRPIASTYGLYGIDFPDAGHGWVVGGRGLIAAYGQSTVNRPLPIARKSARVRRGGTVSLRYRVAANTPTARVTITISRRGRVVKRLVVRSAAANRDLTRRFVCRLARGVYRWRVTAMDGIGTRAAKASPSRKLTVR